MLVTQEIHSMAKANGGRSSGEFVTESPVDQADRTGHGSGHMAGCQLNGEERTFALVYITATTKSSTPVDTGQHYPKLFMWDGIP
jgi:hypothetical protein